MSLFEKMKQGASEAAKIAQQTVEATRLKSQKYAKEKEMARIKTKIGQAVFQAYTAGDLSGSENEVKEFCEELTGLQAEINQIEERIKMLKAEKSCVCGRVVPIDVRYCPDCGKRFTDEPKHEDTFGEIRVICPGCKSENDINAGYCIQCGEEMSRS
ncbi:zinc ribbon domain-containing protein [Paenibacillus tarimensis]